MSGTRWINIENTLFTKIKLVQNDITWIPYGFPLIRIFRYFFVLVFALFCTIFVALPCPLGLCPVPWGLVPFKGPGPIFIFSFIISYHMISYDIISYRSRGRGCRRGRSLAMQWKNWNFFQELYPEKWPSNKNKTCKKEPREKSVHVHCWIITTRWYGVVQVMINSVIVGKWAWPLVYKASVGPQTSL